MQPLHNPNKTLPKFSAIPSQSWSDITLTDSDSSPIKAQADRTNYGQGYCDGILVQQNLNKSCCAMPLQPGQS